MFSRSLIVHYTLVWCAAVSLTLKNRLSCINSLLRHSNIFRSDVAIAFELWVFFGMQMPMIFHKLLYHSS
ncbi:hypothetical protein NIES39_A05670 [Arthrospira platensis NIES-39]|nr:hypothetical protein NIES39_A05670 [Arthrospira platensis NIES-39]